MRRALTVLLLTASATSCSAIEEAYRVEAPTSSIPQTAQTAQDDATGIPPELARAAPTTTPAEQAEAVTVVGADGMVACRLGGCSFSVPEGYRVLLTGPEATNVAAALTEAAPTVPVDVLAGENMMAFVIAQADQSGLASNAFVVLAATDEVGTVSEELLGKALVQKAAGKDPGDETMVVDHPAGHYGWAVLTVHPGGSGSIIHVPQRQLLVPRPEGIWIITVTAHDALAVGELADQVFTSLTFS